MPRFATARRKAGCGRASTAHFRGDAELPQRDFDLTPGPGGPAAFQRQDGIGRRSLGKGRRVWRVIPAWRGQRTATNQNGRRPSWTAWGALSPNAADAVHRKSNNCIHGFSSTRPLAAPVALLECRGLAFGRSTWSVEGAPQPDTGRSVAVDQWARTTRPGHSSFWTADVQQTTLVGGATRVSFRHGGGVGMGYSQHASVVFVGDGTDTAAKRIERALWNDPATALCATRTPATEGRSRSRRPSHGKCP